MVTLAVLLAILLFLPLLASHFSVRLLREVIWQNPVDMAMLEWTGAFLNIFLFLLLIEHFRQTTRLIYAFLSCGFLSMGILNFVYALSNPGSETAMWVKALNLLLVSLIFTFCIPARRREQSDFLKIIVRYVVPCGLIALFTAWIPYTLKQMLPLIFASTGSGITIFGRIYFVIPGAFFFIAALPWLREYMKEKRRDDLVFAVVLTVFAQMTLVIRVAKTWGVLWWAWHLVMVLAVLFASLYLLAISVHRSVVWKLIFSLGLTFGLTVILASGIIQSQSEKRYLQTLQRRLHLKHRQMLQQRQSNLLLADQNINVMKRQARGFFQHRRTEMNDTDMQRLRQLLLQNLAEWPGLFLESGFMTSGGRVISSVGRLKGESQTRKEILDRVWNELEQAETDETVWSKFYFDRDHASWVTLGAGPIRVRGKMQGIYFNILDMGEIWNRSLVKRGYIGKGEGRIIYNARNGEVQFLRLPKTYLSTLGYQGPRDQLPLLRQLAAATLDVDEHGKILLTSLLGRTFFISAHRLTAADWVVLNLVDLQEIRVKRGRSKYFFAAVGMVTLLWGFVILLLLLNFELAVPLKKILGATERLEEGDFSVQINSKDPGELGVVSRSFDHMVLKLQEVYDDLAQTVKERTLALEEVKKANQAKAIFFANISHELKTPLHGILSFSRMGSNLDPENDSQKIEEYFYNIDSSGKRLMRMIDEILDLARMESGYMEFTFATVDLFFIARQVYDELDAALKEKEVSFVCDKPEFSVTAEVDREMIRRVIRNLVGNSLKFTGKKTEIRVEFAQKGEFIKTTVFDQGPGIPEEDLETIFDKFVQSTQESKKGGTGIGLATCREIVMAHGGSINAENRPEGGAAFTFILPIKHQPVSKEDIEEDGTTSSE